MLYYYYNEPLQVEMLNIITFFLTRYLPKTNAKFIEKIHYMQYK